MALIIMAGKGDWIEDKKSLNLFTTGLLNKRQSRKAI